MKLNGCKHCLEHYINIRHLKGYLNQHLFIFLLFIIISLHCKSQEDSLAIFETDSVGKYDLVYLKGNKIDDGILIARYKIDTSKIAFERGFRKGVRNGWERYYYISGLLCVETHWKKGKKNGRFNRYTQQGVLDSTGKFKNGKPNGVWKGFLAPGVIVQKDKWIRGKRISSISYVPAF